MVTQGTIVYVLVILYVNNVLKTINVFLSLRVAERSVPIRWTVHKKYLSWLYDTFLGSGESPNKSHQCGKTLVHQNCAANAPRCATICNVSQGSMAYANHELVYHITAWNVWEDFILYKPEILFKNCYSLCVMMMWIRLCWNVECHSWQ